TAAVDSLSLHDALPILLGAGRVTLVGEIGYVHVGGLESKRDVRYGRDAIFGTPAGTQASNFESEARYGWDGFVTANSWGYRLRADRKSTRLNSSHVKIS